MDNKMYNKPMYKCAICDEVYDNVSDRMKCEASCLKKAEEEAKKAAEEKKKLEQCNRKAEVDEALRHARKLVNDYIKDYGSYELYNDLSNMNDDMNYFWPSRLLHDWLF